MKSVADLGAAEVRRIAIGDPAAVPAGVYARQYLERIGQWARLEPKIVPVRQRAGGVDGGAEWQRRCGVRLRDRRPPRPALRVAATITGPHGAAHRVSGRAW